MQGEGKTRMRVQAFVGVPLSLIVLGVGLYFVATDRPNSTGILAIGLALVVVWAFIIPVAIRKGRM